MESFQKFQTLCLKIKNLSFYLSGVLLCFNIFAISQTPELFLSKFNLFQSQKIYFFELFLLLGVLLNLLSANTFKFQSHYIYLLIAFNPYLSPSQKIIAIIFISQITQKQIRLIFKGLKHGIFLNLIPAIYQLIFQKSLGLFKLGESLIHTNLTQLAKVQIGDFTLIRSYGFLAHPNILAFLCLINPTIKSKFKDLINLITLSGSNTLSLYIKKFFQKKYLNLTLVILLLIIGLKGFDSITHRVEQLTTSSSHQNFQPIHNIFLDSIKNLNLVLLYAIIVFLIKNFHKVYFLLPIMLLDHFLISSYACFLGVLIFVKDITEQP